MRPIWRAIFTTALDVAAAALVVAGVALIFVPAAYITAGVALLALSWHLAQSDDAETRE